MDHGSLDILDQESAMRLDTPRPPLLDRLDPRALALGAVMATGVIFTIVDWMF